MSETISWQEWAEKSRRREVCGILGCRNKPIKRCNHCGLHYCKEHAFVINTLAHRKRQPDFAPKDKDPMREATLERADLERRTIPRPGMPKYKIK